MLGNLYGVNSQSRTSLSTDSSRNLICILTETARTGGNLTKNQDLGVKVASPVGTLCGQLLFGWLADIVGRKRMCTHLRKLYSHSRINPPAL